MAKRAILGRLRKQGVIVELQTSGGNTYIDLEDGDQGGLFVGTNVSLNGTTEVGTITELGGTFVDQNSQTRGPYHIVVNTTWSGSPGEDDTIYFDVDSYGLKVSKVNADIERVGPKDLLFDSRVGRRGVVYAQGFQASASGRVSFVRGDDFLEYIPLITHEEEKMGYRQVYSQSGSISQEHTNQIAEQVASREDSIQPIRAADYLSVGPNIETGTSSSTFVPRRADGSTLFSGNSCENLSFKALRIPCAYGYMQDYYYDNIMRNGNDNVTKGKKRAIAGAYTNSTAGFSTKDGVYVSRPGTDVLSCEIDDLTLATDTGIANIAYRGEEQKLTLNYSSVISSTTTLPTITATVTSSTSGQTSTQSVSFYNPYTTLASPLFGAPTDISSEVSGTIDGNYNDFTFTFENAGTINFSLERKLTDLAIF